MYLPSADHPNGVLLSGVFKSNSSSLVPPDPFLYRLKTFPFRFDANTISLPSGDQTGKLSSPGSNVKRELLPVFTSTIQISPVVPSRLKMASCFPSGDNFGLSYAAAGAGNASLFPAESTHTIERCTLPVPTL